MGTTAFALQPIEVGGPKLFEKIPVVDEVLDLLERVPLLGKMVTYARQHPVLAAIIATSAGALAHHTGLTKWLGEIPATWTGVRSVTDKLAGFSESSKNFYSWTGDKLGTSTWFDGNAGKFFNSIEGKLGPAAAPAAAAPPAGAAPAKKP